MTGCATCWIQPQAAEPDITGSRLRGLRSRTVPCRSGRHGNPGSNSLGSWHSACPGRLVDEVTTDVPMGGLDVAEAQSRPGRLAVEAARTVRDQPHDGLTLGQDGAGGSGPVVRSERICAAAAGGAQVRPLPGDPRTRDSLARLQELGAGLDELGGFRRGKRLAFKGSASGKLRAVPTLG